MRKWMLFLSIALAAGLLCGCTTGCNHGYLSDAPGAGISQAASASPSQA